MLPLNRMVLLHQWRGWFGHAGTIAVGKRRRLSRVGPTLATAPVNFPPGRVRPESGPRILSLSMAMAHRKPYREIEIKLPILDLPLLLQELRHLRARPEKSVHEQNALFDTPRRYFSRRGAILRIRTEVPAKAPGSLRTARSKQKPAEGLLTYKDLLPEAARSNHKYKIREEIEYRLPNARRFERLLLRLGLGPWFRYEKFRTRYRLPRLPGLHVDLDETPIGPFLELEGPKRAIDTAARLLGFRSRDYIAASYLELYITECHQRGRTPGHMMFLREKSLR
jgi:adenylate cyclase class IV